MQICCFTGIHYRCNVGTAAKIYPQEYCCLLYLLTTHFLSTCSTAQRFFLYPVEFHRVFLLRQLFTTQHISEEFTVSEACSQFTRMYETTLVSSKNLVLPEVICLLHTELCNQCFYSTEVMEVYQAHFGTRASRMVAAFTTGNKRGGFEFI